MYVHPIGRYIHTYNSSKGLCACTYKYVGDHLGSVQEWQQTTRRYGGIGVTEEARSWRKYQMIKFEKV